MYQLVSAPLTGVSLTEGWAQVISHPNQHFVCAVSFHGQAAHQAGRDFTTLFLQTQPKTALELHQFVEEVLRSSQSAGLALQFAAQLLTEETSVMCSYQGFIYLRRANKIGLILSAQDQIQIVEGKTHQDDVYVLATAATSGLDQPLQKILGEVDEPDEFVTQLMKYVLEAGDSSLVAATYVRVIASVAEGSLRGETAEATTQSALSTSTSKVGAKKIQLPSLVVLTSLVPRIKKVSSTVVTALRQTIQPLFSRDVYVRRQSTKKIARIAIPAVILVVAIVIGVMVLHAQQAKQLQAAQAITQPAEAELAQIQQIANDKPLEARQRTDDLMAMLQGQLPQLAQQKTAQQIVQKELDKVKAYSQTISGQQAVNVLPTFFDLRLFQSDFLANKMDIEQNNVFFLDPDKKQILALDTTTKQTTLLPLGQLPNLKDFVVDNKNAYLLGGGVSSFTLGSNTAPTLLMAADLDTEPATMIRSFGNFIYLLNPDKRNVFRYEVQKDNTLSSPSAWLKPGEKFDVSTVQSMTIDGDVWFSTKTGEINRFTSGRASTFNIVGLKEPFTTQLQIFTKDSLQNLYVLEPAKNRLVVLNKDGTFLKEVTSSALAAASDLVADETTKTIYVLSGSLVYQVQL